MPLRRASWAAAVAAAVLGAAALLAAPRAPAAKAGKGAASAPASFAAGEPLGLLDTRFWITNVRTSSAEDAGDEGRFAYGGDNAFDDVAETLWMEGHEGAGVGDWVQVTFNRPVRLTGVGIAPGPDELNRPTALLLEMSTGAPIRVAVGDALGARRAALTPVTTRSVKIAIDEIRVGAVHDRTAVSEILLYGAPLPYAEPVPAIMARLRDLIDSGAYQTAGEDLGIFLAEGRLKRIEVAWYVATRGVESFAVASERPLEPVARLLHALGDDGDRVLVREAERLLRDPALGAAPSLMKVDAFWFRAAMLNECYRGLLDVAPAKTPDAGGAVGAAWHGCAGLLRNGDVRGLTVFAHRLIDGGGAAGLAVRAGVAAPVRLAALAPMREALRGRGPLRAFKKAFADLKKLARKKGDAALVADLAAAAAKGPLRAAPR